MKSDVMVVCKNSRDSPWWKKGEGKGVLDPDDE